MPETITHVAQIFAKPTISMLKPFVLDSPKKDDVKTHDHS